MGEGDGWIPPVLNRIYIITYMHTETKIENMH